MSKRKRSAVWTCRLLYLLAVTFYLLHVGVIRLLLYLHLVSYHFYIDITDTKWSNTWYQFYVCWYCPSLIYTILNLRIKLELYTLGMIPTLVGMGFVYKY